jgi:hypothetical protein
MRNRCALDFGRGVGPFYPFLVGKSGQLACTGIDPVPEMLNHRARCCNTARRASKGPRWRVGLCCSRITHADIDLAARNNPQGLFLCLNRSVEPLDDTFAYVPISTLFSYVLSDSDDYSLRAPHPFSPRTQGNTISPITNGVGSGSL